MKISNSKKELARIINENGGWRDGAKWAAMDKTDGHCNSNSIGFFRGKYRPECYGTIKMWRCRHIETAFMGYEKSIICEKIIGNWHQSCLSREEYFHLYPAPDADGWIEWDGKPDSPVDKGTIVDVKMKNGMCHEAQLLDDECWSDTWGEASITHYRLHKPEQAKPEFCDSVTRSIPEPESKPTIEQLVSDYRNRKDYADRKQVEADASKADAEAKLEELVAAGKANGLVLSVADADPELAITDWRDLRFGDEIEYLEGSLDYMIGEVGAVCEFDEFHKHSPVRIESRRLKGPHQAWPSKWRFIRRP